MKYNEKMKIQKVLDTLKSKDVHTIIYNEEMKKGINKYLNIITCVKEDIDNFNDEKFQKLYKGFYRMRRNKEFCNKYFKIGYEQIKNSEISFDILFDNIKQINNKNEASFSSKLLHTINNKKPILDKKVLINLNLYSEYIKKNSDKKEIYKSIERFYYELLKEDFARDWIVQFDTLLTNVIKIDKNVISDVKKIDFILWKM